MLNNKASGRWFEFFSEARRLLLLGIPIIVAQLLQFGMTVVDTAMVGHFRASHLAAIAIGGNVYGVVLLFVTGVLIMLNPIIGHHYGGKRLDQIAPSLSQGLWLSIGLAIIFFFLLRESGYFLLAFGIDPELIPVVDGYLDAMSWGLPATYAFIVLRSFNESLSCTKPVMCIAVIGLVVNVVANYILVFGKFGFPELGSVGTGWASTIVWWVMFAYLLAFTWQRRAYRQYCLFQKFFKFDASVVKEFIRLGAPNGFSLALENGLFAAITLLVGTLGTLEAAGSQVALIIWSVMFMIPLGLSTAITTRVGQAAGGQRYEEAKMIGVLGIGLAGGLVVCTSILLTAKPEWFIQLYTKDEAVVDISTPLVLIAAFGQIFSGLQVSAVGALRGLKDTKIPLYNQIVAYWVVGMPFAYLMGVVLDVGTKGLWYGLVLALMTAAVIQNSRLYYILKQKASIHTVDQVGSQFH